jgi:hypothetical protein
VTATCYPVAADSVAATVSVLRATTRARGVHFLNDRRCASCRGYRWCRTGRSEPPPPLVRGESDYVKVLVDGVP